MGVSEFFINFKPDFVPPFIVIAIVLASIPITAICLSPDFSKIDVFHGDTSSIFCLSKLLMLRASLSAGVCGKATVQI